MMKALGWFAAIIIIFGAIAALELNHFSMGVFNQAVQPTAKLYPITLDGAKVYVKLATTPEQQQQGLSNTSALEADNGMLFIFPRDGEYAFWMKDMNYSLDIIWIDSSGHVVYIAPDLSPQTYPQTFQSDKSARFVLEVNAGFAAQYGVRVGDVVRFR